MPRCSGLWALPLHRPGVRERRGALGLDAVEQPHRTPGRARGDLEFGVQSPGVIALSIRRVFVEPGCLPDALGEILGDSLTAY
jgi:hypothetical protein